MPNLDVNRLRLDYFPNNSLMRTMIMKSLRTKMIVVLRKRVTGKIECEL